MMLGQRRNPWDQIGMDAPLAPMDVPQVALPQGALAAPAKPKLNWGAIIADALSGLAGQQGQYPQRVARERAEQTDFERGEQRYQRQRADANTDWERNKQWELANRAPYRFEDNAGNVWERGPDGQNNRIFTDTAPKQYIQDGMAITVPNPYNASPLPSPPATIPEDLWNTGKPMGGPLVSPAGNFRRPY